MGRLIDCNGVYNAIQIATDSFGVLKGVIETNMLTMLSKIETVEAIPKADYEARLKADMVAMLTEILTDFDNQIEPNSTRIDCESIIEQKIQAVEGKTDGEK